MATCKRPDRTRKPRRAPLPTPLMANRAIESHVYQQIFLQVNEKIRHERELASLETRRQELTSRLQQIQAEMKRLQALLNPADKLPQEPAAPARVMVRTVGLQYGSRRGSSAIVASTGSERGGENNAS